MKCYHHNDADGRCAGAIVYQYYPNCEMIEVTYKDVIDVGAIESNEEIYIVDFSFKPDVMKEVLKITKNITWIDHHKTAMEYDYGVELAGARYNEFSGCELTWEYFYPNEKIPGAVVTIGDYDTWKLKFGDYSKHFITGLRLYEHGPTSVLWRKLFEGTITTDSMVDQGKICAQYRDNFCKDYRKNFGFKTDFAGYKCYALGLYGLGSSVFGEEFKKNEICISFGFDGSKWVIGLYSDYVDVGNIAKRHGGGGHKGAAGFECDTQPAFLLDIKEFIDE